MSYPVYDTDEYRWYGETSPSSGIYWNTGTVGAGPSVGDIEIIVFWMNGNDTLTPPTGFTKLQQINGALHTRMICWRRFAAGGTTSGYISNSTINRRRGSLNMIVRGCETTGNPWDSFTQPSSETYSSTGNIQAVSTSGPERLIVSINARYNAASAFASDDATNYSEIFDYSTGTYDYGFSVYNYQKATAGSVAADSYTLGSTSRYHNWVFTFKPPSTGYANKVNGVSGFAKVNGVATGSIAKVNGAA